MENKVLAKVNGKEITTADVDVAITKFPQERQSYFNNEQGRTQLLEQIIAFELVYNYAKEANLEEEDYFKTQVEVAKKDILTQAGIDKLLSKTIASEAEALDFYLKNQDKFVVEESVRAKHILIDNEAAALEIKKKISEGMTFEEAASSYSTCPSSAQGGDLGSFTKGRMVPEFEQAAFTLELGEVSEPVQTQFGYHLIKVEEKVEQSQESFEDVKEMILTNLSTQKKNMKYVETIEELKKKYKVEIV